MLAGFFFKTLNENGVRTDNHFDLDQYEQFRKQDYSESKLPVDTHKKLADYFKPHNQRLYEFLGRKFDWE